MKQFVKPEGHECGCSSGIHDGLTIGTGELDSNGYWEHGCYECARAWEKQFPEDAPVWPFSEETLFRSGVREMVKEYIHPPSKPDYKVGTEPGRIVAAAVLKDGTVWTAKRHCDIVLELARKGRRVYSVEQGFWTIDGWYIRREAALGCAIESGQVEMGKLINKCVLTSEDLW